MMYGLVATQGIRGRKVCSCDHGFPNCKNKTMQLFLGLIHHAIAMGMGVRTPFLSYLASVMTVNIDWEIA